MNAVVVILFTNRFDQSIAAVPRSLVEFASGVIFEFTSAVKVTVSVAAPPIVVFP